jgi:hypothetical protein
MQLTVDATGIDDFKVRTRAMNRDGSLAHLLVRAGPLMVYALDPVAVTDLASAWAAAQIRGGHLLPLQLPTPRPARAGVGAAYPIAEVVVEGRQRWNVKPPELGRAHLEVGAGWFTVRVHDRVALDTQVRAWSEASAHAIRIFGRSRAMPFDELLERQQIRAIREAAARDDDRLNSQRPRRSGR